MKKNLLFVAMMALAASLSAQTSFKIYQNGDEVTKGASLVANELKAENWGTEAKPDYSYKIPSGLSLKNISSEDVTISSTVIITSDMASNFEYEFCFGMCTSITDGNTSKLLTNSIEAGVFASGMDYALIVKDPSVYGTVAVRYVFTNTKNPGDATNMTQVFTLDKYSNGIAQSQIIDVPVKLFKSGSELVLVNEHKGESELCIMDITGKKIVSYNVNGDAVISSDIKSGIYIYSLVNNGKVVATNKFVVR